MPAPDFLSYTKKVLNASRRADANATEAQRAAGNARVGTVYMHGMRVSIEYPKGASRKGKKPDGTEWSRVVRNPYGYVCGTKSSDDELLDVWIGDHPASQLVFTFDFLTSDGEHDEIKAVLGCRNVDEAKKVIRDNYPENFMDERIGEIRGMFMGDFKKFLGNSGMLKKKAK